MFVAFISTSLITGIVILLLLLFMKGMGKRYRPKLRYWIWLVLALRLLFPMTISLPHQASTLPLVRQAVEATEQLATISLYPQSESIQESQPTQAQIKPPATALAPEERPQGAIVPSDADHPAKPASRVELQSALQLLWLVGVLVFLEYHLLVNISFRRKVLRWGRPVKKSASVSVGCKGKKQRWDTAGNSFIRAFGCAISHGNWPAPADADPAPGGMGCNRALLCAPP